MKETWLRAKIISEFKNLITVSCSSQRMIEKFEKLHITILKKHYNAVDVSFDYHRNRVYMNMILDDSSYSSRKIVQDLPLVKTNIWYGNLFSFLKNCIEKDDKSIAFYASLLRTYKNENALVFNTPHF